MIPSFIQDILFSFFAFFFIFFFPGLLIINYLKLKINRLENIIFSTALGFVFFTLISFVLDALKIFWLTAPFYIFLNILYFLNNKSTVKFKKFDTQNFKTYFFLLSLAIIFSLPMLINYVGKDFIKLSTDAPWHFSLINELVVNFPPNHPNMSNVPITPYHFFSDYVIAKTIKLIPISINFAYFQLFPLIIAFLWSFGVFILMQRWMKNKFISICSVIMSMFAGSFSFIPFLLGHSELHLNSAFGMLQPDLSLINPPFAMSIVIIIFALFCCIYYLQEEDKKILLILPLFFGIAAMFKVYAGMLLLIALFIITIYRLFKKDLLFVISAFASLVILYFTYWRFVGGSGFLVLDILWAPHDVFNSNFPFIGYMQRMQGYRIRGDFLKTILLESFVFISYLIGNIGTRLFGVILLLFAKEKQKFISVFGLVIISLACFSFFIPLFFIQSIKPIEITQMFNYFLFFLSIISAVGLYEIVRIAKNKKYLVLILILFFILTFVSAASDYYLMFFGNINSPVSRERYLSYKFLKKVGNYNSTILEVPSKTATTSALIEKWFHDQSDVNLPALSNKSTYLTNGPILFPKVKLEERLNFLLQINNLSKFTINSKNYIAAQKSVVNELNYNRIRYIYSSYAINIKDTKLIYKNEGIYIYEFKEI